MEGDRGKADASQIWRVLKYDIVASRNANCWLEEQKGGSSTAESEPRQNWDEVS